MPRPAFDHYSGDVAFTKHSTIMEVAADGTAPQAWSAFDMADMAIVCPSGGCKEVSEFLSCHIARSPAFSVMTTAALRNSAEGQAIQAALMDAGSVPAYLNATIGLVGNFAFSEDTKGIKVVAAAAAAACCVVGPDPRCTAPVCACCCCPYGQPLPIIVWYTSSTQLVLPVPSAGLQPPHKPPLDPPLQAVSIPFL